MTEAGMKVSFADYRRIALEDPSHKWELARGHLREKPPMTMKHNRTERRLYRRLIAQLSEDKWEIGETRLRISTGTYYVPDLTVLPMRMVDAVPGREFEVYAEPVPLVVEIWSPSTGNYDVDDKLLEYQLRGDLEIWRIHPFEHSLTTWRRLPDASYTEEVIYHGIVRPVALPGVSIDLDELLA